MVMHEVVLSGVILLVVFVILVVAWQTRNAVRADNQIDTDQILSALGRTWRDLEFDETVGRIETHASQLRELHFDITQMLRNPHERGEFGEHQLDILLSDHLPPEMYGIREQVVDGKTPDAYIDSTSGVICIDSKFPLDNYEQYVQSKTDDDRDHYARLFRQDVETQLQKIAADYVRPESGTTNFAFAFIPSESVYYHLVTEEYDLLREYTHNGVQVVSPLTLGQKLELIKADVQAQQLSEEAERIQHHLERLSASFDAVEDEWQTLQRHIRNAKRKADDVDRQYETLRADFDRIEQPID